MTVEPARKHDLECVLDWLQREYDADGSGFWSNRNIISRSLGEGELWVIRHDGEAVAFQVGKYSPDIACVRKDKQRQGYGTALFEASLARAMADDVNVLSGECSPRTSLPFWQKHGFQRYGSAEGYGEITVRRILHRDLHVPSNLPRVPVTVSFYPEAALYRDEVAPISVQKLSGGRRKDGVVLLERRVLGLKADEPDRKDLAVRIDIDGIQQCFCKAKYEEAQAVGVQCDWKGGAFYIDALTPRADQ